MKFFYKFFIFSICFLCLGCFGRIKETVKCIAGISTKKLEEARKNGTSWIYNVDKQTCFDKTLDVLTQMGAYIHIIDRKNYIIVAMGFEKKEVGEIPEEGPEYNYIDTTEVGFFFEDEKVNRTRVELSSLSSSLLEAVSKRFFPLLNKKINNLSINN